MDFLSFFFGQSCLKVETSEGILSLFGTLNRIENFKLVIIDRPLSSSKYSRVKNLYKVKIKVEIDQTTCIKDLWFGLH